MDTMAIAMPTTTIAPASSAPATPSRRWRSVRPRATKTVCTRNSTAHDTNTAPCSFAIGASGVAKYQPLRKCLVGGICGSLKTVEGCRGSWGRLPAGIDCRMVRSWLFFLASCPSNQDLSGKRHAVSRELLLHRHGELVSGGDPSSAMPAPDVVARLSSTAPFSRHAQRGVPSPRR
jgi:hypothetical protein